MRNVKIWSNGKPVLDNFASASKDIVLMMGLSKVLGTVIIVNYNGGHLALETVRSVVGQSIVDKLEILVVDNQSTDGSDEQIATAFPDKFMLLKQQKNLGFAGGNNVGFKEGHGKYFLLLNNDAIVARDWAEILISKMEADASVGMCTPKIFCMDSPGILDNVGHKIFFDGLNRSIGHLQPDGEVFSHEQEVLFASGCAGAYRAATVRKAGGFPEHYFAYGDDADLGLHIRLLGFRCLFIPSALVYHKQSGTAKPFSSQKLFWIERNRIWVLLRFLPLSWIILSPAFTILRLFGAWIAAKKGKGVAGKVLAKQSTMGILVILFKAWLEALVRLPQCLLERHKLWSNAAVSQKQWHHLLRSFRAKTREMMFQ